MFNSGVTIDVKKINAVSISSDKRSCKVGRVATYDLAYTPLDAIGLMIAGGRIHGVGAGGIATRGELICFKNCSS